jgi:mono/diheme cytochrome c family protein
MKIIVILSAIVSTVILFISCSDIKRDPGWVYMPDMAYSRAFETYSVTEAQRTDLEKQGIYYSNTPVPGTIKRGELFPFLLTKDKDGDSTNYVASKQIINPLPTLDTVQKIESERLFLVNCAICHGQKLDANGPLYNEGKGPFPVRPAMLVGDPKYTAMPEGQMFYSMTYGKNKMGSYASQLDTRQRWMLIDYIKSKQAAAKSSAGAPADSTAAKK